MCKCNYEELIEDGYYYIDKTKYIEKLENLPEKGTETVVDRIFITGVASRTLDSLTPGFNISKNITRDIRFDEMMGFTHVTIFFANFWISRN